MIDPIEPEYKGTFCDFKVTPRFSVEDQVLLSETTSHGQVIMREVIRFKEEKVRQALNALGWVELGQFQQEVAAWASITFPNQTAASKIAHLADEVEELSAAPMDGEEMADCLILLLNIAEMAGVDLMAEAKRKMEKNRARKWGPADERGVIKHLP